MTAAVIEQDGRYLLCRRHPRAELAGKWEFPGGKIETGETAEECLVREIREELGLEVRLKCRLGTVEEATDERHLELIAFCAEIVSGTLQVLDHEEVAWVNRENVASYDLAPADVAIGQWVASGTCKGTL